MSQKYNIINESPAISKSEIELCKNFDLLLKRQSEITINKTKGRRTKGVVLTLLSIGLLYFLYTFFGGGNESNVHVKKEKPIIITENVEEKMEESPVLDYKASEKKGIIVMEKKSTNEAKQSKEKINKEEKVKEVAKYNYVEASPVEGLQRLYKYFEMELSYPKTVLKDSIEGTVLISFVVGKEGEIKNIEVLKSLSASLDNEAIGVIKNMPTWKAAMVNGEPVESKLSIPLTFNIKNK